MKMEDDTHEVNHVKKKHMKSKASVPKNKNSILDNGSFEEVKKDKKKRKKVETEVEELLDGVDETKNKKKKSKIVDESLNYAMESSKDGLGKKKKKKKQLADVIHQEETLQSPVIEEIAKDEIKGKKRKNKSKQTEAENIWKEEEDKAEKDEVSKKIKKRKKNILVAKTGVTEDQSKEKKNKSLEEETSVAVVEITKPKKKPKVCENGVKIETPEVETVVEEVKKKKKKKKKKEAKTEEEEEGVGTPEDKENNRRRKAASCTNINEDSTLNTTEDAITKGGTTEGGKKGKKEKGRKASVEVSEVEEMEPKRKKRKKESKIKEDPLLVKCSKNEDDAQSRETGDTTSKKKKISVQEEQVENDIKIESGAKKKKIKAEVEKQQEPPQVDVVLLSEKRGNADEVTIKQGLGQWSTAQFDSSAQQHKFLRLMGGFKKGFQPAAADTGKANTAMGKEAQQQLQQELIGEFERAQSRRMDFSNRGAGLGFTAPSKKKFSIDVNACRSVRFDD